MPDIDSLIFYTQAHVIVRASDSALLAAAKKKAPDPSIFDQYPPFLWANEISSDRLDAYYTVMDPATTLPNYAADAAAGVAVLIGHNTRDLPVGYSLTGVLERDGDVTRVTSDAYGLTDEATAPVINRVRAGIVRDDSVGFSARGAQCICSICGLDMWRSWDCWHVPGFEYDIETKKKAKPGTNGSMTTQLCTGLIVNAHLSEYSLVYDGATPGAAVLQAQRCAEAGRITPQQARLIEQRYRINLPGQRLIAPGYTRGQRMGDDKRDGRALEPNELRDLQMILEDAGVPTDRAAIEGVRWMAGELARLKPLAADGETYRKDLIDIAEREAVRALGAEAGAAQRTMLEASPISLVKSFTASWRAIGDATLKGGRLTIDGDKEQPTPAAVPVTFPGLYQG